MLADEFSDAVEESCAFEPEEIRGLSCLRDLKMKFGYTCTLGGGPKNECLAGFYCPPSRILLRRSFIRFSRGGLDHIRKGEASSSSSRSWSWCRGDGAPDRRLFDLPGFLSSFRGGGGPTLWTVVKAVAMAVSKGR